jgi:uncharacterized membrane protein
MLELIKTATEWVATGVEGAAALIIAFAALRAGGGALLLLFAPADTLPDQRSEGVRLHLARWLAVALEFALAADILRTAIAPSWSDIGKLAAIAALRTILNYFLQQEIAREAKADASRGVSETPARP